VNKEPQKMPGDDAYVCALETARLDEKGHSLTIDELLEGMTDFGRTNHKMLASVMKDLARYDIDYLPYNCS